MELTGRLTADAKLSTLKDQRKVINFSVVIKDRYKTKEGEVKEIATFINCTYWVSPGIAPYLTKGTLVELFGRIGVNAWTNTEGHAKASLTFHVSNIKMHGRSKQQSPAAETISDSQAINEDLPF
jgi:single-strand DNA-binding protein